MPRAGLANQSSEARTMSFFEIIHQAHQAVRSGNDGQTTIKHALMHANYLGSSKEVRDHLHTCKALAACSNPLSINGAARADARSVMHRCGQQTPHSARPARLYSIKRLDNLAWRTRSKNAYMEGLVEKFRHVETGKFQALRVARLTAEEDVLNSHKLDELLDACLPQPGDDGNCWFWLSDEIAPSAALSQHLQRLGLYVWRKIKAHEPLLLLEWADAEPDLYKPNWLHNGLYFYFDAAPECAEHGYTRCLATGDRGCKEWVAIAATLGLPSRVHLLQADRDVEIDDLPVSFWRKSADRIRS
jgi:hypothetical protein